MAVTLKEIARDVGVTVVTVSKVLRGHEDISKKTRALVLQRAKELGYRPNLTARSLVTGKSSLVGLLVPELLHPFFAEIARALAENLRKQGMYLLICSSEGDPELERNQLEHLLSRGLDAIVVAPVGGDEESLGAVVASKTLLVVVDRKIELSRAHFIGSDDILAGEIATEHLIDIGCKRIAHIRGPNNSVGAARLEGYKRALKKAGIPFRPELVSEVSSGDVESNRQGEAFAERLLTGAKRADGLFCHSDPMAIGAMRSALRRGLRIPRDVAIIGCGNLHYDASLTIPLSSIDQKSEQIGHKAADLILEKTCRGKYEESPDERDEDFLDLRIRPTVVIRDSTMRASS